MLPFTEGKETEALRRAGRESGAGLGSQMIQELESKAPLNWLMPELQSHRSVTWFLRAAPFRKCCWGTPLEPNAPTIVGKASTGPAHRC